MAIAASERYHALDALRGAAMFLGVLLHAAIPYTRFPLPFWPVRDASQSRGFDFFLLAVHDFRMQIFFFLAGFFGCLLYSRHGWRRTAIHRLKRIALPLALAMITIQPAVQAIGVYAAANQAGSATAFFGTPTPADAGLTVAVLDHLAGGGFLGFLVHLWFLWFLILCFAIMLPLAWLADRLHERERGGRWDRAARWLFVSRLRWPLLALLTWPLLMLMETPAGPDTALGWTPPPHLLAYYFSFFLAGWTLYRHRDLLDRFTRGWKAGLAVGNLLVFPLGTGLLYVSMKPERFGLVDGTAFVAPARFVFALYTWFMLGGLTGLFLAYLSKERAWVRWLADSSYWCYLASLPPILLFQHLLTEWAALALVKFAVVSAATTAVLLVSYRWCVRYTWIGVLLNGVRVSQARARAAEPAIVEELPAPAPGRRAA
jgi:peptidoglycan/LPS O-acetylase OafA/YrhL